MRNPRCALRIVLAAYVLVWAVVIVTTLILT